MASPTTAGPAHRVQSAVEVYGYPHGHLGHLTPEEEDTLKQFKALCEENGYYNPGKGASEPPSHDDATMLSVSYSLLALLPANRGQAVSTSTALRHSRSLEAVPQHRGLAQGNATERPLRDDRFRPL
jgi:hypothetical protein